MKICNLAILGILLLSGVSEAKSPNIVMFVVDDMGWKDLGCFGAELYETPNIDELCASGLKYTQMYTSAAICSPARATLMTGLNPLKLSTVLEVSGTTLSKKDETDGIGHQTSYHL